MSKDILIVDDEADIRSLIRAILEDEGYAVREAESTHMAYREIEEKVPDLIVLDIWLQESDKDGIDVLKTIKAKHKLLPVLMISGHGTIETAVNTIKFGAYYFIEKPFKSDRLLLMMARALETAELRKENKALKDRSLKSSEELIGCSPVMENLKQQIDKIAAANSRVLIQGEAGTGKEVVARALHQKSDRHEFSFFALNCASLNPERFEEELFGVVSPDKTQKGMLELANGGTVFLDEIADMPLETQAKILRVLQENIITPVGSHEEISINVRFIASTNKDLENLIKEKKFREDLYYRLNVVTLGVPPLKKRIGDIENLTAHFLNQFANQTGQVTRALSTDAISVLEGYQWPGNVRQLRNMMEWMTIMSPDTDKKAQLGVEDLPAELSGSSKSHDEASFSYMGQGLREARENFERTYLLAQIERFDGNISKTAKFIGMERSALHRKLKSLDISLNEAQNGNEIIKDIPLSA